MDRAVVLTRAQRRALTAWVLGGHEGPDLAVKHYPPLGRQVVRYDGIDVFVQPTQRSSDAVLLHEVMGRSGVVTHGPSVLVERGVPASVFGGW